MSFVRRKSMDDKYHFGCQLTADLIAMNTAGESSASDLSLASATVFLVKHEQQNMVWRDL